MCSEGELLENFHIQLAPIPLPELTDEIRRVKAEGTDVRAIMDYCGCNLCIKVGEEELETIAGAEDCYKKSGGEIRLQRRRDSVLERPAE